MVTLSFSHAICELSIQVWLKLLITCIWSLEGMHYYRCSSPPSLAAQLSGKEEGGEGQTAATFTPWTQEPVESGSPARPLLD